MFQWCSLGASYDNIQMLQSVSVFLTEKKCSCSDETNHLRQSNKWN